MNRLAATLLAAAISSPVGAVTITTGADWEQSFDGETWVAATICADDASAFCPAVPAPEPGGDAFAYFRVAFAADPLPSAASVVWFATDANVWAALNGVQVASAVTGYFTHGGGGNVHVSLLKANNVLQFTLGPRNGSLTTTRLYGSFDVEYAPPIPEPSAWALLALGIGAVAWRRAGYR